MKTLLFILALVTSAAFANEVRDVNGQKFVMFKASTSATAEAIVRSRNISETEKVVRLQAAFAKEKTYCKIAGKELASLNRPAKQTEERCQRLLNEGHLAKELAATEMEDHELANFPVTLAQYFTLLLMF